MLTRPVCPQSDPTIIDELTSKATADLKKQMNELEKGLLDGLTGGQRHTFMRLVDLREEIAGLEHDILIAKMHCPACPQRGSRNTCPE